VRADPWSGQAPEQFGSDIVSRYLARPLQTRPGTHWVDQSSDPELLAYVIERATGQRYSQYVSQALWQRIGAADAWLWLDRAGGAPHIDRGFLVRQGDWIRVAEVLLRNGNYQGDEILPPRWIPQMLQPASSKGDYGSFIRLGAHAAPGMTPFVTGDVFVVGAEGNRLWIVPSLQLAILRTGSSIDWDDARIPNLIIRGARDFVPPAARPGSDLSKIVPNH
jgi:CubicO group peptidase (beta-lactamase class C family)